MKKVVLIALVALLLIVGVITAIRLAARRAVADAESGLSPFTALPLVDGRNIGMLAPGESRWYEWVPYSGETFQRQADLTLFFTPDDGNRSYDVNFQIFPASQITGWYQGDASQMQNLGAGGVVSRDGNPVTGELLWSGWIMNNETFYVQVSNGTDVTIDFWLFTDNVIAAELGPAQEPAPVAEASPEINQDQPPDPVLGSDTASQEKTEQLLPVASELGSDQVAILPEVWEVPAGTPTRLVIPAIALDTRIVPVDQTPILIGDALYGQWNTVDNMAGWHNSSAELGQVGNTVLNGHSDVNAAVFRNLEYVDIGDEITIFSNDRDYQYIVTDKFLVEERDVSLDQRVQNAAWIAPTQDERLTLVTCAKPGATHRLIVIGRP
jgi:LPXTG-site transpeptidase (sortase) family protein